MQQQCRDPCVMTQFLFLVLERCSSKRICLPMQERSEMHIRSPSGEDPLEKEMATHSSILAWEISWAEEAGRLMSMGSQRVRHN